VSFYLMPWNNVMNFDYRTSTNCTPEICFLSQLSSNWIWDILLGAIFGQGLVQLYSNE
jgi:hypothetical protein